MERDKKNPQNSLSTNSALAAVRIHSGAGRFIVSLFLVCIPGMLSAAVPFLPLHELPTLFPHVVSWITDLDKQARESGRALTALEYNLARNVGVTHPEDVRILSVPHIPLPAHPCIRELVQQVGLLTSNTVGLTAMHGVIARSDCTNSPRLLAHEFAHVEQYERLGTEGFLREYIQQLSSYGYQRAPFELEAEAKAVKAVEMPDWEFGDLLIAGPVTRTAVL